MALICFVSQKGSPGTTLTALAVAASWPGDSNRRRVLVEADPFGGVLALRYQLGHEPGLVTLAAAMRGNIDAAQLWSHAQELPGGVPVIIGPDRPDQTNAVFAATGDTLGRWLGDLEDVDVIVDLGRVANSSQSSSLLGQADLVLMVARPTVEQLQPAAERLRTLSAEPNRVRWVLVGEQPHDRAEVEAAFGFAVAGVIADDPRGARALEQGGSSARLRRSAIVRSASALAFDLSKDVGTESEASSNGSESSDPETSVGSDHASSGHKLSDHDDQLVALGGSDHGR